MILFTIIQWIIIMYCKSIVYCEYVHVDMAVCITLEYPDTNNLYLFARHSIAVLQKWYYNEYFIKQLDNLVLFAEEEHCPLNSILPTVLICAIIILYFLAL